MERQGAGEPRWIAGIEPPKELLEASGTEILEIECRQQPQKLRELIGAYDADEVIRMQLRRLQELAQRPGPVLFLGMGGSYCSAISGAALLQSEGRSSLAVDAGEWLHYSTSTWGEAALSVLLTTSGESAELVELFKLGARFEPALDLALICNNPASTCWGPGGAQAADPGWAGVWERHEDLHQFDGGCDHTGLRDSRACRGGRMQIMRLMCFRHTWIALCRARMTWKNSAGERPILKSSAEARHMAGPSWARSPSAR